jgi:hypothetical protein
MISSAQIASHGVSLLRVFVPVSPLVCLANDLRILRSARLHNASKDYFPAMCRIEGI